MLFFIYSRTKSKSPSNDTLLISPMVDEVSPQRQKPVVPQPTTTNITKTTPPNSSTTLEEDNMLLDFGMATSVSATTQPSVVVAPKKPDMMLKDDPIFSDLISPSPPHVASSSSSNIDTLLGLFYHKMSIITFSANYFSKIGCFE